LESGCAETGAETGRSPTPVLSVASSLDVAFACSTCSAAERAIVIFTFTSI
jgi:hypothetical protein